MRKSVATVLLVLVSSALFAVPQASPINATVQIPFQFFVGTASLPAGTYTFWTDANFSTINVTSADGKARALSAILTRLSARPDMEAAAVFDVIGNDHYLSEFYPAGGIDGFCFKGAASNHTHSTIKSKK
jgi:hypothetical protein